MQAPRLALDERPQRGARPRMLLVGCGALARELAEVCRLQGLVDVDLDLLPPQLHNRPELIPGAVRERVRAARRAGTHDRIVVGYADCGTGGLLDRVCDEEGVERLPGAHCYELFAGSATFDAMQTDQLGTFYLTDFLVRAFDRLVVRGLGLDRHPELRAAYFGAYVRVVYLQQRADPELEQQALRAAEILDLPLEIHPTGLGELGTALAGLVDERPAVPGGALVDGRFDAGRAVTVPG